jgi:integrase
MPAYGYKETRIIKGQPRKVMVWRYKATITLPDGSTTRITGTPDINTKKAALAAELAHIKRIQNPAPPKPEETTLSSFVDDRWWPTVVNKTSTVESKRTHLDSHLIPRFGTTKLTSITNEVLENFVKSLTDDNYSLKTVKNILATLHKALAKAVEWDCLTALPVFPTIKPGEPEWDHLTVDEVATLLAAARDDSDRLILMFLAKTGARAGELLAAKLTDIDWTKKTIRFQRSRTRGETGATKSGRHRAVPLSASLLEALRKRHGNSRAGLIFPRPDGSPMLIGQLHECLWRTLKRAGLRDIRLHDLRHTFASNLAAAGVPIPQLQKWMGHSTIIMTMRYAHFAPDANMSLIAALDAGQDKMIVREVSTPATASNDGEENLNDFDYLPTLNVVTPSGLEPEISP